MVIQSLDEDVEGLTSTIIALQQELKTKNEKIQQLEAELTKIATESFGEDVTDPQRQIAVENHEEK